MNMLPLYGNPKILADRHQNEAFDVHYIPQSLKKKTNKIMFLDLYFDNIFV